jgi:hypothetical protein
MKESAYFQSIIMKLQEFWAQRGCLIWQPYYTQVGAGTMNPATFLRVLGPEPWNVAYVEPSIRPDDGRYGDNPNRLQQFYQFQVILKPDPGNPKRFTWNRCKPWASTPLSMISALWRITGSSQPLARGAWAGRCGWMGLRSPNSPISSSAAGLTWTRYRWRSPMGLIGLR